MIHQNKKLYAIIVAGGKGLRMQSEIPKQFMLLAGKPVLMHSIDAFYEYNSQIQCIVVLPESQIAYWNQLCVEYAYCTPHTIVEGGAERFYSVLAGLSCIASQGIVAIHDGVRPLLSNQLIHRGFACASHHDCAIPIVDSVDSLRFVSESENYQLARSHIKRVQTPQFFDVQKLQKAYTVGYKSIFTDDASVWEYSNYKPVCILGDEYNIKLTTPIDFQIAELVMKGRNTIHGTEF